MGFFFFIFSLCCQQSLFCLAPQNSFLNLLNRGIQPSMKAIFLFYESSQDLSFFRNYPPSFSVQDLNDYYQSLKNPTEKNKNTYLDLLVLKMQLSASDSKEKNEAIEAIFQFAKPIQDKGLCQSASLHEHYMDKHKASSRQKDPQTLLSNSDKSLLNSTAPALNIRTTPYQVMCDLFSVANQNPDIPIILELAKSEIIYSDMKPGEYVATGLAAAIRSNYQGEKIYFQADHYQVEPTLYRAEQSLAELDIMNFQNWSQKSERLLKNMPSSQSSSLRKVETLIHNAIKAHKFNIDIDPSTLVSEPILKQISFLEGQLFDFFLDFCSQKGIPFSEDKNEKNAFIDDFEVLTFLSGDYSHLVRNAEFYINTIDKNRLQTLIEFRSFLNESHPSFDYLQLIVLYQNMHAHTALVTLHYVRYIRALESLYDVKEPISIGVEERHIDHADHQKNPSTVLGSAVLMHAILSQLEKEELTPPSKLALQTGTAHGLGGIIDVNIYSRHMRASDAIGVSVFVQHGTSTITEDQFPLLPRFGSGEAHLATQYQNDVFQIVCQDFPQLALDFFTLIDFWVSTDEENEEHLKEVFESVQNGTATSQEKKLADLLQRAQKISLFTLEERKSKFSKFKKKWTPFSQAVYKNDDPQKTIEWMTLIVSGQPIPELGLEKGAFKDLTKELTCPFKDIFSTLPPETLAKISQLEKERFHTILASFFPDAFKPYKWIYSFGQNSIDGGRDLKNLLGGKGAGLAEMTSLKMPVPPGLTITTEACAYFHQSQSQLPAGLQTQVLKDLRRVEKEMGRSLGDPESPLLVSVRSGAAVSMPGMMDTILNLGINDEVVEGLSKKTNNPCFAWDSYRRFIQMFSDTAMGIPKKVFEDILTEKKKALGLKFDTQLSVLDLQDLVKRYKEAYKRHTKEDFPQDVMTQLWTAVKAVFDSWNCEEAEFFRQSNEIEGLPGTAVNIQSMVFGNTGNRSATGVCFSRNPATGESELFGEYLLNAQGEDVVAGIRTPQQITLEGSRRWAQDLSISEEERSLNYPSLEESMPEVFQELKSTASRLEKHYNDMQDIEFTIEDGKLYFLQTRTAKRAARSAVTVAVKMVQEGQWSKREALLKIDPSSVDQLLHPVFDEKSPKKSIGKGLNASPGAAVGEVVFTAEDAVRSKEEGRSVILVRAETSPEDIKGMTAAKGILTATGGKTSHAAVVARGMGKCCVSGCSQLSIDPLRKQCTINGFLIREGDFISIDGSSGDIYTGQIPKKDPELFDEFRELLSWANEIRSLGVRANADTVADAQKALEFLGEGIGLCRTEHMFFQDDRINFVRQMILAQNNQKSYDKAIDQLFLFQKSDFVDMFKVMGERPFTIRLLDPPLHEFLPRTSSEMNTVAFNLGVSLNHLKKTIKELHESNPMLGHRGSRLGITHPEIYEMQARAIIEAAIEVKKEYGLDIVPEIMIPLIGDEKELAILKELVKETADDVIQQSGIQLNYVIGTMIEIPRAALTADEIARHADFFSYGTNDLTQMTLGFSRDDSGSFLPAYVEKGIYKKDPFQSIDQKGVGQLVQLSTQLGRKTKPKLKVGICGEHGGDPDSIHFFHKTGLDYVSCSPFRIPTAIITSAQAEILNSRVSVQYA